MSPIVINLKLIPARIAQTLWSTISLLFLLSISTHELARAVPIRRFANLAEIWNPDLEPSIPTWFSTFLLAFAAFLLWQTSKNSALADKRASSWRWLSAIFTLLSIDEVAGLHERLIGPVSKVLHTGGALVFAWVAPGLIFVAAVALAFTPFLRSLTPALRRALLIAGAAYVSGALGMEMIDGYALDSLKVSKDTYFYLTNIEEFLEMSGVTLLITAVLRHWQNQSGA